MVNNTCIWIGDPGHGICIKSSYPLKVKEVNVNDDNFGLMVKVINYAMMLVSPGVQVGTRYECSLDEHTDIGMCVIKLEAGTVNIWGEFDNG